MRMIQHVTREVDPDLIDSCVDFYRLLGFSSVPAPVTLRERAVWLQLGPTQLHLLRSPGAAAASGHVAILAQPYGELVERLRERGIAVQARREHWGAPRSYVRDPAGNLVELIASAPNHDA
jgi:catechol 2,3-dioxygenase-like lactoylglutathione lyase family enzyme